MRCAEKEEMEKGKSARMHPYALRLSVSLARGRDTELRFHSNYILAVKEKHDMEAWNDAMLAPPLAALPLEVCGGRSSAGLVDVAMDGDAALSGEDSDDDGDDEFEDAAQDQSELVIKTARSRLYNDRHASYTSIKRAIIAEHGADTFCRHEERVQKFLRDDFDRSAPFAPSQPTPWRVYEAGTLATIGLGSLRYSSTPRWVSAPSLTVAPPPRAPVRTPQAWRLGRRWARALGQEGQRARPRTSVKRCQAPGIAA